MPNSPRHWEDPFRVREGQASQLSNAGRSAKACAACLWHLPTFLAHVPLTPPGTYYIGY